MRRLKLRGWLLAVLGLSLLQSSAEAEQATPVDFVVQLTRPAEGFGHRRALLQLDRALTDLGEDKVRFTVVAYEDGIQALRADNDKTVQLLTKLANRGVLFKACRISMRAWELTEQQFPLEVEFVPAGAPEVLRLQMLGYKYWKP